MARQLTLQSSFRAYDYRTNDFRPPQWQPKGQVNVRTGALAIFSVLWLASYGWLGARLLATGEPRLGWIELALALVCIVAGVFIVVGWRAIIKRWALRLQSGPWPALSREGMYKLTPSQFEEYVAQRLFARHGYEVVNTPDTRDGGIDIIVVDPNGRRAVVQCKRYRDTVGAPAVRDLYGTMIHNDVDMAYLVATGKISDEAREWAAGKPLILIDGDKLLRYSRSEPESARSTSSQR